MLTEKQIADFDRDGFVLVEGMFSAEETALLCDTAHGEKIQSKKYDMPDADGRSSKLALWMDVADDVWGAVSASPRVVGGAQQLLRQEVYHWHSKVMLKEPRTGGAWEWHQDYGYWYNDGCIYPHLVSCLIALNDTDKENGCLKVLVGSHLVGRLDHGRVGNQSGADPERLRAVEELLPVRYVEAPAGSALFFHCNTLHSSEPNLAARPRTSYICCYNALANAPYGGHGHGKIEPITLAPDDAILRYAAQSAASA